MTQHTLKPIRKQTIIAFRLIQHRYNISNIDVLCNLLNLEYYSYVHESTYLPNTLATCRM